MNSKNFSDAMNELDSRYVDEAIGYKAKARKRTWIKWAVPIAACLTLACVTTVHLVNNQNSNGETTIATTIIADAPPMIYVNDTLYKQITQTSYSELMEDFVYLGVIESDITNSQSTITDGVPKANFQANHPILGSKIYQYGDNIVAEINGSYWLYENTNDSTSNMRNELSEEEKMQLDPFWGAESD